ncbi:MAG: hypothetical protein LBJ24_07820 [Treponema sp.]|jgi:hypothetical protein|nr:hypothetical protein [Treponema sp.]
MKKLLVVSMILVCAAAGLFAQDLKLGGRLFTGLRFEDENDAEAASIGFYNDEDDGYVTRLDLDFALTKANYGVKIGLRNDWLGGPDGTMRPVLDAAGTPTGTFIMVTSTGLGIYNAYTWADFYRDIINIKFGLIDDVAWATEGDEEFQVSKGVGLRVEIKPIQGLNAGVFLPLPDFINDAYAKDEFGGIPSAKLKHVFPEAAFGGSYEHDLFNMAAGFKLDGGGDGLVSGVKPLIGRGNWDNVYYNTSYSGSPPFPYTLDGRGPQGTSGKVPFSEIGDPDSSNGRNLFHQKVANGSVSASAAIQAYLGFSIKAVEHLKAVVEAQAYNLGDFNKAGFVWIDEVGEYEIFSNMRAGAILTQWFYGKRIAAIDDGQDVKMVYPYIGFKPYFEYDLNELLTVGGEIGFSFQPKWVDYEFSLKPKLSYKLGDTAVIGAYYMFDMFKYARQGPEGKYNLINTFQINFNWTF